MPVSQILVFLVLNVKVHQSIQVIVVVTAQLAIMVMDDDARILMR